VAAGIDLIDTADVYSRWAPGHLGGESESMIGEWLASRGGRQRIILASKCGQDMGSGGTCLSRAYILQAVDASLARLRTDYIDLYQAHRDDPNTPLEETLGAFADVMKAGKVRAIGASNYTAPRFSEALDVSARLGLPRFECLQPHYNLLVRQEFETELAPLCARESVGIIPYYALASGFLTGKYRRSDDLKGSPRAANMAAQLNPRNLGILVALDEVSAALHATPAQVALAWLMARGVTAPIASASKVSQLDEQLPALDLVLDGTAMTRLSQASL
jgi:aryl-alcohol dehydrogenase-like predicted oxidoreductase